MSGENPILHKIESEAPAKASRRLHLIALNGFGALFCAMAAIHSFMGEDGTAIESGSLQIYNLTFLVGTTAFACFLVSMISQKRKWGRVAHPGSKLGHWFFFS